MKLVYCGLDFQRQAFAFVAVSSGERGSNTLRPMHYSSGLPVFARRTVLVPPAIERVSLVEQCLLNGCLRNGLEPTES